MARDDDRGRLQYLAATVGAMLLLAAVAKELRAPAEDRTWHGRVVGVPYDLRPPTVGRLRAAWYNPDDPHLFTPRAFGVGWAVNLARLRRLLPGT